MNNRQSMTALMSAFVRAYHAERSDDPVFADTKARELMTETEYEAIKGYILGGIDCLAPEKIVALGNDGETLDCLINTHLAPTPLARAKYCEDSLKSAVRTGCGQYVILGAGYDTFAFRKTEQGEKLTVFEVDHPLTQQDKATRIKRAGLKMPPNLRFVPVDFEKDNLEEKLTAAGFDRRKKSFFSWLGVSYYLSGAQIDAMLSSLTALSSDGSTLLFDFADENLFSTPVRRVRSMLSMAESAGEPMKSCFAYNELERLLEKHGFLIYELLGERDIQERFFAHRKDGLKAFEHINFALTVFKKQAFGGISPACKKI